MNTKQYITLEVAKGDFIFSFQMPQGATWGAAIDAGFEVLQKLNELAAQSVNAMQAAKQEEVEEESEVVSQEGE